jgi:hypothetical protein
MNTLKVDDDENSELQSVIQLEEQFDFKSMESIAT